MTPFEKYERTCLTTEDLPKADKLVLVHSLDEKMRWFLVESVLVSFGEHIYLVEPHDLVPEGTEIVRDVMSNKICWFPVRTMNGVAL